MQSIEAVAPHPPSEPRTKNGKRHIIGLPTPTYRLLTRAAAVRGLKMTDALYVILRDDLHRQEDGEGWAFVPAPFSIKPTYGEHSAGVLLANPWFQSVILTGEEACLLASAIRVACEDASPLDFSMVVGEDGRRITLSRGGSHLGLHVGDERDAMPYQIALDVAAALESASVHTGPLKAVGPGAA